MSDESKFVTLLRGFWYVTEIPGVEPSPVDLTEILELMRSSETAESLDTNFSVSEVEIGVQERWLQASWVLVGLVEAGGLRVESVQGHDLLLGPSELLVLDHFKAGARDAAFIAGSERSDLHDTVERLFRAEFLHLIEPQQAPSKVPSWPEKESVDDDNFGLTADEESTKFGLPTDSDSVSNSQSLGPADRRVPLEQSARNAPSRLRRVTQFLGSASNRRARLPIPEEGPTYRDDSTVRDFEENMNRGGSHRSALPGQVDDRIPVYAIWHEGVGPTLALGLLLSFARTFDGGSLNEAYDLRFMETADSFLADLPTREGPAVLLCSNYVWSTAQNLEAANAGKIINKGLLVIHGGPNTPKYEADANEFLETHLGAADILVRGEGEVALCEILASLRSTLPKFNLEQLTHVQGLAFRDSNGRVHRTGERERVRELGDLPSPYLTGEYDHLDASHWPFRTIFVETNRGCPYGCTFCDWGSSTMSRVRKFTPDRVLAECEWAQRKGFDALFLCDANFGILPQDEEIAERLVELHEQTGFPCGIGLSLAKSSTRRVMKVVEVFLEGGIPLNSSISLQSIDPTALTATDRDNISIDVYLDLAAALRRRGYGLQGDLILGLPGQTYEAYKGDLQFMLDHEIMPRTWPARVLVNSPMNDAAYRDKFAIKTDELGFLQSSSTMSSIERQRSLRLRMIDEIADRYIVLRHILRLLQWDYDILATTVEDRILDITKERPNDYPLISWVFNYFDVFPIVALGRVSFYDEVRRFIYDEFEIAPGSDVECAIQVQRALIPGPGRVFPEVVQLDHDYVSYFYEATRSLYASGRASTPSRRLKDFQPAEFTVSSDPLSVCDRGIYLGEEGDFGSGSGRRRLLESDFHLGSTSANELMSPLIRILPPLAVLGPSLISDRIESLKIDPEASELVSIRVRRPDTETR